MLGKPSELVQKVIQNFIGSTVSICGEYFLHEANELSFCVVGNAFPHEGYRRLSMWFFKGGFLSHLFHEPRRLTGSEWSRFFEYKLEANTHFFQYLRSAVYKVLALLR